MGASRAAHAQTRLRKNHRRSALHVAARHASFHFAVCRAQRARTNLEALETRLLLAGNVVINEIHYHPDNETEAVEFIELTNAGDAVMDLSGAQFTDGVSYTFPSGTTLAPGAYILVAGNPADVMTKWGVTAYGPWTGKLSNDGEKITLKSSTGTTLDTVTYGVGFPWPVTGDFGDSLELINPTFDNSIPGNWRSSNFNSELTLLPASSTWRYRKGISEPPAAWKNEAFDESTDPVAWQSGTAPVGYGDTFDNTLITDMQNSYSTMYARNTFQVAGAVPDTLTLRVLFDDGGIVYINGVEVKRDHVTSGTKFYNSLAQDHEPSWETFTLTGMNNILHLGTNTIAIQGLNALLSSNDFCFDAQLLVPAGTYGTTPGAQNSVYATSTPPLLDNLTQSIQQPTSGQDVKITIHATDPQGVKSVNLEYQLVNPGSYIRLSDAAYQTWTSVPMHDDGVNGDALAGDGIYTYIMPGALQTNRRLVRYRIRATDNTNASIVAPYSSDPQPNFAYYVYDGVPAWTGSNAPTSSAYTFGTNITRSLPVYTLIANSTDVANSQWNTAYNGVLFYGTLVYDGVVYDDIQFGVRGENSTYVSGKNKWLVKFNTGHEFAARDNYGNLYSTKWSRLDLNANSSPWVTVNRGMAGLDESLSYRLFQLGGMPASNTNYVQWRVVEGTDEAPANNQYGGDMWGLYLAVENTGGRFLDEHGLPDGNVYKAAAGGVGDPRNLSPDQVSDGSDWTTFFNTIKNTTPTLQWWEDNVDLTDYFTFQAISRAISNIDLTPSTNHVMYHAPDGKWVLIPWDMDNVLVPMTHREGYTYIINAINQYPELKVQYENRAREILDLLFSDKSSAGGQVAQLVDETSRFVDPSDGNGGFLPGWAELDQYMWNYNPRTSTTPTYSGPNGNQPNPVHRGSFYVTPQYNWRIGGEWFRTLSSPDFKGMTQYITNFMTNTDTNGWAIGDGDQNGYGYNYLAYDASDTHIPFTPTVSYTGLSGFPTNKLKFSASAFSDPDNSQFASMEWRVGEISNPSTPGFDPKAPWKYEINSVWESGELTAFNSQISIPAGILQAGHTYRLRVRYKDDTGRWSHWSDVSAGATEFVGGQTTDQVANSLRITELNYHPPDNTVLPGNSADANDYEFIEFKNIGNATINLQNVQFTTGVTMTFGNVSLAPGELGVVVRNVSGFQSRYGTGIKILGVYAGSLDNSGEEVVVKNTDASTLYDFTYDDTGAGWYPSTDGDGPTLVVRNPAGNNSLSDPTSWRASYAIGGSPGVDETHASVSGRYTFYNYSAYDNYDPATGATDDAAIAPDKTALLPGQTASFANYTSYSQGLNGIIVDLTYFAGSLSGNDFTFRVGNSNTPDTWAPADDPIMIISRTTNAYTTRVYIAWDNNAIQNQWLQVTVKGGAGSNSTLAANDVFYFGNAIGETGDSAADAQVNAIDEIGARASAANLTVLPASQALVNRYDFNRDRLVNKDDEAIAGSSYTFFLNALKLIAAPASPVVPALPATLAAGTLVPLSTPTVSPSAPVVAPAVAPLEPPAAAIAPVLTLSSSPAQLTVAPTVALIATPTETAKPTTLTRKAPIVSRTAKPASHQRFSGLKKTWLWSLFGK